MTAIDAMEVNARMVSILRDRESIARGLAVTEAKRWNDQADAWARMATESEAAARKAAVVVRDTTVAP